MPQLRFSDSKLQRDTAGRNSLPDGEHRFVGEGSREPCLILIGGRSGCGKTTLIDLLVDKFPSVYARVPAFTSRARRPGEGDAEYRFVTREALQGMYQRGELLSLDEAYGENYAMSRQAFEAIFASGRFAVKEIHAKNHAAVLSAMPETISVLLQLADERWSDERGDLDPARARRHAEDLQYYAALDPGRFEIVHRLDVGETPSMTAEALHAKLQALVARRRQGVGSQAMDEVSPRGALLQRASALVPVLKERAAQAEQLRQVPPDSVQDLLASGLIRIGNPDRFGGAGLDLDTAFAVSWELGRGCGSTAWCYAVWTTHNWWLGHFPERCQEEYFATGPDTLFSSGLNPFNGTAERVSGGFRVSGRWPFSSGCDAASWVMVACGAGSDERLWLLLPRADCDIVDTWFAAGLRGSGSKDVVVRDVFVPEHRTINPNRAGDSDRTGWELHKRASYGVPLKVLIEWALAAPVIGMAQGVVDEFTSRARRSAGSGRTANSVPLLLRLAEASAEVDTARTLHRADVREILDRAGQVGSFTPLDRARYVRDASFAVNLCVQAVNRLYMASGARAIMDSEPIQRLHRDVHAASHHAAFSWDVVAEQFGHQALGLDV